MIDEAERREQKKNKQENVGRAIIVCVLHFELQIFFWG